ncbi:hypothetical protein PHYBLDRAFT_71012 [Phycomyces blakesleeanus NRRL 1555(-)]|uniref:Tc1-like transposase DDE domain-containing protein n=1 Tax=Phycomyces blakesleeanus (strain ATCC 8743b / DSM 1359 / FGSC 10004 / NBRC 33097 / NRRL 1555) TaxID=763407 RepID=A0A167J6V9_PHYB8|nr:hypothetical protein PHYBLDRAFT_71012 [Phycomyces blakesleeanus NRRL 1555(-)]OAD65318.1 hypothetical protein PHYBLDRAFT_71012 [Phycomyces blakesleeanus NRRL 1555(-)]|eukprot:XP_018283358.1 hypothetical protein PHYBLDRAFT_71012 [Phycomyces blakesleeanus NRRL 1555(-)]
MVYSRAGNVRVWCTPAQIYRRGYVRPRVQGRGGSVVVWSAFGLVEWENLKDGEFIFQEDNAPCHKDILAKEYKEDVNLPVMTWPANSSDLSSIENIWAYLECQLRARRITPMNSHLLARALQE